MRQGFGTWGARLDDDRFAHALAAAGFAEPASWPEGPAVWTDRLVARFTPPPGVACAEPRTWSFPIASIDSNDIPPAELFADAWESFRIHEPDVAARMSIQAAPDQDGLVLARYLQRPTLAPIALSFEDGWMSPDADWRWPLRVGFVPGPTTARVLSDLRGAHWSGELFHPFAISPSDEFCDLLVVAEPLSQLRRRLASGMSRVDANCVLIVGGHDDSWRRLVSAVRTVTAETRSSGLCFVDMAPSSFPEWFVGLIENLSHDEPIDLALAATAARLGGIAPLLFAHPDLTRVSRISHRVKVLTEMAGSYRTLEAVGMGVANGDEGEDAAPTRITRGITRAMPPSELADVTARLASIPDSIAYTSESGPASYVADLAPEAERLVAEAMLTDGATLSRRIVAGVHDATDPTALTLLPGGFLAGSPNTVQVAIASSREGWATAREIFPDDLLPESEAPHELSVVFAEPSLAPEPLVATIILPRTGESTTCSFPLGVVPASLERVRARISVLFRNRLLQTAILSSPVLTDRAAATDGPAGVVIDVEAAIRPGLADLDARRRFDAALLFNHTEEGVSGVQTVAGRSVDLKLNPNLDDVVKQFQRLISKVAKAPESYATIDAPETRTLLVELARHGTLLRDALFVGPWLDVMRQASRIQMVSVDPWVLVPLELAYDRPSPADDAELCPRWTERVTSDPNAVPRCGDGCPGGDALPSPVVCPLAFWCASKVIERRAVDATGPPPDLLRDIRVDAEPTSLQGDLPAFGTALFGASGRVDTVVTDSSTRVLEALTLATAGHAGSADTWQGWMGAVTTSDPDLLLLLPHTDKDAANIETLEIGADAIGVDRLGPDYVRDKDATVAPIVILLGCSTALPTMPFQSFVVKFRANGASVVIGTIATILGRHAAPAAEALIGAISDAAGSSTGGSMLGEIVRDARRAMLSKGVVLALALTAYGDADWRLVPKNGG